MWIRAMGHILHRLAHPPLHLLAQLVVHLVLDTLQLVQKIKAKEDFLQPRNQVLAAQARIQRPKELGDNSNITVGEMGRDEWHRSTDNELAKL